MSRAGRGAISGTPHLSAEAIAAFADGELTPVAFQRARDHLVGCLECAYAVGIQQQMKQSLCGSGGCAVPASLMERLGGIPFSADIERAAEEHTMVVGRGGAFEFPVAAPADKRQPEQPGSLRRSRVFRGGAAALALGIGMTLSPSLLGSEPDFPRDGHAGHRIGTVNVQPVDNSGEDVSRTNTVSNDIPDKQIPSDSSSDDLPSDPAPR